MAEYSSRTSTLSVAATAESRRSRSRNQKPETRYSFNTELSWYRTDGHARYLCHVSELRSLQNHIYLDLIPLSAKSPSENNCKIKRRQLKIQQQSLEKYGRTILFEVIIRFTYSSLAWKDMICIVRLYSHLIQNVIVPFPLLSIYHSRSVSMWDKNYTTTFSAKCAVRIRIVAFIISMALELKLRRSPFLKMTFVKTHLTCFIQR